MYKNKLMLLLLMLCIILLPANAQAANEVTIQVNGKVLDTKGTIIDDRTLVPVRAMSEALDTVVKWDDASRMVTLTRLLYYVDSRTDAESVRSLNLYLWIGRPEISVAGDFFALDVAPQIIDDRTMLPARAICEWFGDEVAWDAATRTVIVTSGPNSSFSAARYHNVQIQLAERDVLEKIGIGTELNPDDYIITTEKANQGGLNNDQDIDGVVARPQNPEAENAETEFNQQWIGEWELRNQGISAYRMGADEIWFSNNAGENIYKIKNVPQSLGNGVIHTGNGVRYQYHDNQTYYNRDDLRRANII